MELHKLLQEKYGDNYIIFSNSKALEDLILHVQKNENIYRSFSDVAGYDKDYTRDYDKDDYDKRYHQYDKTVDDSVVDSIREQLGELVNPSIEKVIEGLKLEFSKKKK